IPGTPLKTFGATHAAYRIPNGYRGWRLEGITLLINADGTVGPRIDGPLSRGVLEEVLGKKAKDPGWIKRFEQLYALQGGQALGRIGPPLPPERAYYLVLQGSGFVGGTSVLNFDGKFAEGGSTSQDRLTLRDVLWIVARLKPFEFEGPDALLKLDVPGDWV